MNKTPLLLALLVAFGSAFAQGESTTASAPVAGAPTVAVKAPQAFMPVNVAPTHLASSGQGVEPTRSVNPFNGKQMAAEELQRELELRKLRTALLEEDLRAQAVTEDLKVLPTRKAVESAQAETQITREQAQKETIDRDRRNADTADSSAKADAAKRKKAEQDQEKRELAAAKKAAGKKSNGDDTPVAVAPAPVQIEILSVTAIGKDRSALVSINGNVLAVADAEMTPLGQVAISSSGTVTIGGRAQGIREASISRMRLSEQAISSTSGAALPQQVSRPANTSGQPSVIPPPIPGSTLTARPTSAAPSPGAAQTKSSVSTMPSVQLPPGIQLVPAQ